MSTRPILKDLSVDGTIELSDWSPHRLDDVFLSIVIDVTWEGSAGSSLFYALVVTPEAMRSHMKGPVFSTRALIVLSEYSYAVLRSCIEEILASAERPTQEESAAALCRYFQWEYEDYIIDGDDASDRPKG